MKQKRTDTHTENITEKTKEQTRTTAKPRVSISGRITAVAAAFALLIGVGAYIVSRDNKDNIEKSPVTTQGNSIVISRKAEEFFESRKAMIEKYGPNSYFQIDNDRYVIENISSDNDKREFFVYNALTKTEECSFTSAYYNPRLTEDGFLIGTTQPELDSWKELNAEYYDYSGTKQADFHFATDSVQTDNIERSIADYNISPDGTVLYVALNGITADGIGFSEVYSVTSQSTQEKITLLGTTNAEVSTGNGIVYSNSVDSIFSSKDGKSVFTTGYEGDIRTNSAPTDYDYSVRQYFTDPNPDYINDVTTSCEYDNNRFVTREINAGLVEIQCETLKGNLYNKEDMLKSIASSSKQTGFQLDDVFTEEGYLCNDFVFSQNSKYLVAIGNKKDESDKSVKIAVYNGETLDPKPIWTDVIENGTSLSSDMIFIDEESGAIFGAYCYEDGSAYTAVIGQKTIAVKNELNGELLSSYYDVTKDSIYDKFNYCDIRYLGEQRYFVCTGLDGKMEMTTYDRNTESVENSLVIDGMENYNICQNGIVFYRTNGINSENTETINADYYSMDTLELVSSFEVSYTADLSPTLLCTPDGKKLVVLQGEMEGAYQRGTVYEADSNGREIDLPKNTAYNDIITFSGDSTTMFISHSGVNEHTLNAINLDKNKIYSVTSSDGDVNMCYADNSFVQLELDEYGKLTGQINSFVFAEDNWSVGTLTSTEIQGLSFSQWSMSEDGQLMAIFVPVSEENGYHTLSVKILNSVGEIVCDLGEVGNLELVNTNLLCNDSKTLLDIKRKNENSFYTTFDIDSSKTSQNKYLITKHPGDPFADENNWSITNSELCSKLKDELEEILKVCDEYKYTPDENELPTGGDTDGYTVYVNNKNENSDVYFFNLKTDENYKYNFSYGKVGDVDFSQYVIPQEYIDEIADIVSSEHGSVSDEMDFSTKKYADGYMSLLNPYMSEYNIATLGTDDKGTMLTICLENDDKKQDLIDFMKSHNADMDMITFGPNTHISPT